jgi:hypothetical protein
MSVQHRTTNGSNKAETYEWEALVIFIFTATASRNSMYLCRLFSALTSTFFG